MSVEALLESTQDSIKVAIATLKRKTDESNYLRQRLCEEQDKNNEQRRTNVALAHKVMKVEQDFKKIKTELDELRGVFDNTLSDTEVIQQIALHTKRAADLSANLTNKSSISNGIKVAACGICKDLSAVPNYVFNECGHGYCEKCCETSLEYDIESHDDIRVCPLCMTEGVLVLARNVYQEDTV